MKNIKNESSYKNIGIAFLLNLIFAILELIGGFLTNSISIFTDAIHDAGDSISIGIAYLLEKKSNKKSDDQYTYGYLRYSILGALITSIILLIGSIIAIYESIKRIYVPKQINGEAMIIFAIFGLLINGFAAYKTSNSTNKNEKSINLHMLEDVLGWIAVLIGSVIIKITNLLIIDPILSIIIAIYILFHVYKYIKEVFEIFMVRVPKGINISEIKKMIEKNFIEVNNIHHIHVWTIDGNSNYLTAHISLKEDIVSTKIIELKNNIKQELNKLNINHITLEIEYKDEKCEHIKC